MVKTGILNQTTNAKTQTIHATVYEQLQIEAQGYYTDYALNSAEYSTLIEFLQSKGIIDSNKVVNVKKLFGTKQSLGNGTINTGDVYVLEEDTELITTETNSSIKKQYELVYYETASESSQYIGLIPGLGEDIANAELISTEKSYVGYYADIDRDGIPDGVIYADLLCGPFDGTWSSYSYSISSEDQITSSKDYYVISEDYEGSFGTSDVLAPIGSGDERFYIMALDDFSSSDSSTFTWYEYSCVNKYYDETLSMVTSTDFGTGKDNTSNMKLEWKNGTYGSGALTDVWYATEKMVNKGWFLPSRDEWVAFGVNLGITYCELDMVGLSTSYWSSSQDNGDYERYEYGEWKTREVWCIKDRSGIKTACASTQYYNTPRLSVRLSTTF